MVQYWYNQVLRGREDQLGRFQWVRKNIRRIFFKWVETTTLSYWCNIGITLSLLGIDVFHVFVMVVHKVRKK